MGWLNRFKSRHSIIGKVLCGEAASADKDGATTSISASLGSLLKDYAPSDIYNADETETSDSTIDARDDDADHDDNELMDEEVALAWADLQESDVPANVHISEFMQADYCLAVILSRTIENHNNIRSVATKVAIQLNCKLGGEAWCLPMLLSNTIVIGYDTYHNAGSRNRTVGAFVASMNQTFTRWYSRVSFPSTHEQLGIMFALHLRDCLSKYAQANLGAFPERIIIFRDGVPMARSLRKTLHADLVQATQFGPRTSKMGRSGYMAQSNN
ncbi:hypothetical protein HPB51_010997 [Rhipicephalus microplus]|uniref:Piwi domain-containing protein n=1 Tax=Rhipicephalus microplus TaxID=6941 RepID=A0A9J6ESX8_RHIMP|nr:hypothetical protein HPB51_010997 [Rhipicephalus microplus]